VRCCLENLGRLSRLCALRLVLATGCCLLAATTARADTNYYWNGGAVEALTSWGVNTDGSGSNPSS